LGQLNANYDKAFEEHKKNNNRFDWNNWRSSYQGEHFFKKEYYEPIDRFTFEISDRRGRVDEKKLEDALNKEVKRKYEKLVQDVTEKAGEIVDASNLRVNGKGEISGIIKGTKADVELWVTLSGGYNIQRSHYRAYCHVIKGTEK